MKNEMNTGACTNKGANIFTGLQSYLAQIFQISAWYRSSASLSCECVCASLLMASISGFAKCMRAAFFCCITVSGSATTRIATVVATMAAHHSMSCATWKYSMAYINALVVYHESPAMAATSPPTRAADASADASSDATFAATASATASATPLAALDASATPLTALVVSALASATPAPLPNPNQPPRALSVEACRACADAAHAGRKSPEGRLPGANPAGPAIEPDRGNARAPAVCGRDARSRRVFSARTAEAAQEGGACRETEAG